MTQTTQSTAEPQPNLFYEDRFWEQYVGQKLVSETSEFSEDIAKLKTWQDAMEARRK